MSDTHVFVRPATSADAAPIGDIHARNMRASLTMAGGKALDAAVLARISPSAFVPAWRHAISAPPDASPQVFAAVEDGVVVGFAALSPTVRGSEGGEAAGGAEVMEMTANTIAARHPELSWGNLMGATTWSERTGREYTDRIIGKAASDRTLHDEFEGILRDDYGQGSRTRAQDLGQAAPAHQTTAQPDRTGTAKKSQSGRAQTSNIAPGPKGGTGGPKPIRSKKALLARFKTRLNENLAKQKASPMPSPSRDRTPHKGR